MGNQCTRPPSTASSARKGVAAMPPVKDDDTNMLFGMDPMTHKINEGQSQRSINTDSSAPLLVPGVSGSDLLSPLQSTHHQSRTDSRCSSTCSSPDEFVDEKNEVYYDAVEVENKFPLTFSPVHHYVPFDGLEARLQECITQNNKTPLRNAFTDPPADLFMVRGPNYLREGHGGKNLKGLKVPSDESPYELIGVNMFKSPERLRHIAEEIGDFRRYFESFPEDKKEGALPEFLLINWLMSPLLKKEFFIVSHVYRLRPKARQTVDSALMNAFGRFKRGTTLERNSQFKYVFRAVDSPSAVKNAIGYLGGERPVLIGKSLTTTYNEGKNHLEINMDVSSSRIASAINGIIFKNVETVVMDCSWLLEGQRDEELPERVLAKIRWIWNSGTEVLVNLDEAGERVMERTSPITRDS